ncbi:MAG: phosphatidate cytidylyltransferase [Ruminococcaceae bacterium]|nr:phosphatidate cytidylyltransferase [Oscillospiraceae bacterium]
MLKRTITAIVALAVFIPVLYFSHTIVFPAAMAALAIIAAGEMLGCIGAKEIKYIIPSFLLAVCPLVPYISAKTGKIDTYAAVCAMICVYLVYLLALSVFQKGKIPFEKIGTVFTSICYVVITFTAVSALRQGEGGKYLYLLTFLGPWVSDTFAYFCGRLFGRHKLIPEVSPKKTVEGSVGGIVFTAVGFVVYGFIISKITDGAVSPSYLPLAATGMIVSAISQIGDLAASLIKRNYGIKDYGSLFPGHGGVLDRFDSVLLTAPVLLIVSSLPFFGNILM